MTDRFSSWEDVVWCPVHLLRYPDDDACEACVEAGVRATEEARAEQEGRLEEDITDA